MTIMHFGFIAKMIIFTNCVHSDAQSDDPPCLDQADANGDNSVDISDATYIVKFIFQGGADPVCGTTNE